MHRGAIPEPVWILTVVGVVLGILFIMGLIITIFINGNWLFIIVGISFSVLTSISILSPLLSANGQDKVKLNEIRITGEQYEYYNFAALYTGTGTGAQKVDGATANTGTNPGGDQKIAANRVNNDNHFRTGGTNPEHAPKIRVTADISIQTLGIAKANIIDV